VSEAVLVLAGAFLLTLALTPLHIAWVRRAGMGQVVRRQGPDRHLAKEGTPSLAGLVFVPVACLVALLAARLERLAAVAVAVTLWFLALGLVDDLGKLLRRRDLGLRARTKLLAGLYAAVGLAALALGPLGLSSFVWVPFTRHLVALPKPLFVLLVVLVVLGTTNAVNLTDGLDGLAGGLATLNLATYAVIGLSSGAFGLGYLAVALTGALLGFLYYNLHPAKVFMGDTGSLALGAALAAISVLTRTELMLPILGLVYVAEALSVMAQVAWFRAFGRRLLRMSPLHHHFELVGWREEEIVRRFWFVGLLASVLGYLAWW
jgi:phospho-N-acetylmuramoyl-pentapeptide-transferase